MSDNYSFEVVTALFSKLQSARNAAVAIQHEFHAAILDVTRPS